MVREMLVPASHASGNGNGRPVEVLSRPVERRRDYADLDGLRILRDGPLRDKIHDRELVSRDGVRLFYQVIGQGPRTIVLANGLGARFYAWAPLLERFADDYRFICWDYRGLFNSETELRATVLEMYRHAKDVRDLLDAEGVSSAVLCGWSMGVQVALEFATMYPRRAESLILINGTHGHLLGTVFQPFFRVPWLSKGLHELIQRLIESGSFREWVAGQVGRPAVLGALGQALRVCWGHERLPVLVQRYFKEVTHEHNFSNFLRLCQELDAHSVYHHLREIKHPALVISGGLDMLTPSYQSRELAKKLPNVRHVHYPLASHFLLFERSRDVVAQIDRFLIDGAGGASPPRRPPRRKYTRASA